jgi:mannosyl-3-phosphoglycerate phosphatase
MEKLLFITDLDGTLLHPRTYSFEAAAEAIKALKERGIPLVFCSSKTRVEIEYYRERTGNTDIFVSENGGGVFIPTRYFRFDPGGEEFDDYDVLVLGTPYPEIREKFVELRERLGIEVTGFGDMTPEAIAELAGMTINEAAMAMQRDFDEPFVFEEGEERTKEFLATVEESGLHWTRGRFYHLLGTNDKGKAARIIKRLFQHEFSRWRIKTVCLGDNPNDLPMLEEADVPVLIQKEDGSFEPEIELPGLVKADGVGPEGWNRAVMKILAEQKR